MRLYRTRQGNWAGTQADATRIAREDGSFGKWEQVEVPTDKPGLIAWLSKQPIADPIDEEEVRREAHAELVASLPTTENARKIRIEEEIQSCDMPRLAVLAENVAWRFHELAKQGRAA